MGLRLFTDNYYKHYKSYKQNNGGKKMTNENGTDMKNGENSTQKIVSDATRIRLAEKTAKKAGVTKGAWTTAIISLLVLVIVGIIGISKYNTEQKNQLAIIENQKQSFTETITERDSLINESMQTFAEIEKNLSTIKEKEKIITMQSSNAEFSKDRKQRILQDIEYINTLLDQNKKKIASLTAQLNKSGGTIKGLQVKIAELEASMKVQEGEISDLKTTLVEKNFQIDQLNTRMNDQQIVIAQKDEKISKQTYEINKAYLAYGTYKDLKAKGLLSKDGGFLGLGKKKLLRSDFADSSFTQVDITEFKTIPVNSKEAKFITEHPSGSYMMIRDKDKKISSIEIKDPEQFWKISKYAVVEIRN
jgi:uncharacterized coiled-coil protein SlyX